MKKGIIGKKLGMTQIFDENGNVIPVTVIEAGPCTVVQKKTVETDGYNAVQLGFEDKKEKHVLFRAPAESRELPYRPQNMPFRELARHCAQQLLPREYRM